MENETKKEEILPVCEKISPKDAEFPQNLTFVRLRLPKLIPKELIEEVKGRTFTPEQFYIYQDQQIDNPYNFLFALIDEDKKIQGYLWAEINILDGSLFVNTFSIRKKFWGKGKAIPMVIKFLEELKQKTKAPRVFWITTNEKFFVKHGFKRSKNVLMEYNLN
jgi:N-acetylglutamate synthase-like GNAT family acetyltransferase